MITPRLRCLVPVFDGAVIFWSARRHYAAGKCDKKQKSSLTVVNLFAPYQKAIKAILLFAFPDHLFLIIRYLIKHRRIPNLIRPSTFTEKTLCKMLFDRNELLPIISDKLAVRDLVRARVGPAVLIKIYAVYESETEIRLDELPDKFVLKATHGSGWNYFVASAANKNPDIIIPTACRWLGTNYGRQNGEWAYKSIHPRIFAEEYLEPEGNDLIDYKFFCFDGDPKFVKVIVGPHSGGRARFFDLDWNTFEVAELQPDFPRNMIIPRPPNFAEMVAISRRLSRGFDFLRVDLYNIGNRIFFGELTSYHGAGKYRFRPREYDRKFGSYWCPDSMTYLPVKWNMPANIRDWPRR